MAADKVNVFKFLPVAEENRPFTLARWSGYPTAGAPGGRLKGFIPSQAGGASQAAKLKNSGGI